MPNRNAVLSPNSSMPSAASSAPSSFHSAVNARPESPRVVMESIEYSSAAGIVSIAPRNR